MARGSCLGNRGGKVGRLGSVWGTQIGRAGGLEGAALGTEVGR